MACQQGQEAVWLYFHPYTEREEERQRQRHRKKDRDRNKETDQEVEWGCKPSEPVPTCCTSSSKAASKVLGRSVPVNESRGGFSYSEHHSVLVLRLADPFWKHTHKYNQRRIFIISKVPFYTIYHCKWFWILSWKLWMMCHRHSKVCSSKNHSWLVT